VNNRQYFYHILKLLEDDLSKSGVVGENKILKAIYLALTARFFGFCCFCFYFIKINEFVHKLLVCSPLINGIIHI